MNWVSQTEKDKYHLILFTCGIEENGINELIYKVEIENKHGYQWGSGEE